MTARLANLSYEQIVRGAWRSASGIGGVATLPEYRRQGHIRQLLDTTFADMRQKGQAVSVLYPFKHAFYEKFGYVRTNPFPRLRIETSALTHYLPLTEEAGETRRYERIRAIDATEPYKEFLHQAAQRPNRCHDYSGYMRDPNFDADDCANDHMVFVKERSNDGREQIVGAALYKLERYATPDSAICVGDWHWTDLATRDRLLAYFALHGAGLKHLQIHLPPDVNFHSWLADSTRPYDIKLDHLPIMVRVMDVVRVLNGVRVGAVGQRVAFAVQDAICPWVGGTFEMVNVDGLLSVGRVDGDASIRMTIEGVTALAYGALAVEEIVHRGWMTGIDKAEVDLLENWFPQMSVFNLVYF